MGMSRSLVTSTSALPFWSMEKPVCLPVVRIYRARNHTLTQLRTVKTGQNTTFRQFL
jgi:hypothetical protein